MLETNREHCRLTEQAYQLLKAAITSGGLQPKDRLYEIALAKQFHMSRTPIREAIQRLASEGMAEVRPDGVYVSAFSVEDIQNIEQVNRALQCLMVQLAAAKGTSDDLAQLETSMARMEACSTRHDVEGWIGSDQELHCRLLQMAGNPWLAKMLLQMKALIARVRNIALADPQRMEQSTAEHRTVVNAIQRHDPDGAQRAMHDHLLSAEQIVSGILQNVAAPLRGYRF